MHISNSQHLTRFEEIKEALLKLEPLISNLDSKAYELLLSELYSN